MFLSLQSFHRFTIDEVFQRLSADGTQAGASDGIQSSPDGRMVVFQSLARITPDDTNDVVDVYLKDLASGTITRLSADGTQAGNAFNARFSPDGRSVMFESYARITADDTNNAWDVYVKDLASGTITRLSSDGMQPGDSTNARFSPDGRFVVFDSRARIAPDDTNDFSDIYLKDLETGTITRVSSDGAQPGDAWDARFSPDGASLIFQSAAGITADDTNNDIDIFVKDLAAGTVTRLSVDGSQAGPAFNAQYSADGQFVVFQSLARIAPDDTNDVMDVYVKDLATDTITRISADGAKSGVSFNGQFSPDGRSVMFESLARITPDDTNDVFDIYVMDLSGGISRISADGTQAGDSVNAQFSPDGRFVTFESVARITPDDTNDVSDIYLKDLASGTITRLSSDGMQAGHSFNAQFSPDGRFVFLESQAQLTPGDTNALSDLYRVDLSLRPYETAVREGRFVETRFAVGAASQVEIAWGDGAVETRTPAAGSVAAQHAYATTGSKAAVVTVHEGGQDWAVPFLVDLASGQMSRDTTKPDTLSGSSAADHLTGDGYANILIGNAGDDILDGGAGADRLEGGAGDDTYLVDDASDLVIEAAGAGIDTIVVAGSFSLATDANVENLTLTGNSAASLFGNGSANTLTGNAGANVLHGGGGRDRLFGGAGADRVYGDGGSDTLGGGAGKDSLYAAKGRANHDMVVFDTRLANPKVAKQNIDKIYGFGPKFDSLGFDDAAFTNRTIAKYVKKKHGATLDHQLKISSGWFRAGDKALDQNDFFIYNAKTHKLYFDQDGSGHKAMVEIASFSHFERHTGSSLTYKDLFLI